ncbi:hypothetical protein GH714_017522 [Hevea brasiliensis]|uniref:Uncharacterized protein n=1 Tax=Hevea brasiliensis TaxID=3981 RepID=A0A6A6K6Y0_HEVBR|nr:hypothetical protein GH714_017522 [Hevea brasiliensis]
MSPAVEFASQESHEDDDNNNNERLDFILHMDLTAANFSLPNESFLKAAISLKDQVCGGDDVDRRVVAVWVRIRLLTRRFIRVCWERLSPACGRTRHVTFLCGRGGIYALGAVVANYKGDQRRRDLFLNLFLEVAQERALPIGPEEGGFGMSYDLMYGRAGFLWSALFLNQHLGEGTLPSDLLMPVVDAVAGAGQDHLIIQPAPDVQMAWDKDAEDVKGTLRYMMSKRFLRSGNYPSSEGNPRDKLMQWSHGATGMAITLCKASQDPAIPTPFL